jgi:hypothetical protein
MLLNFQKRYVVHYLEFQKIDKVQKPSNSECYTLSSEPFGLYTKIITYGGLQQNFRNCACILPQISAWMLMPVFTFLCLEVLLHNKLSGSVT